MQNDDPGALIHFEYHYGDDLENEFTIQRTEWYNIGSHPWVFFDGQNPVPGATTCLDVTAQYRDRISQRMAETGGESPIAIDGEFVQLGNELVVTAEFTKVDPVPIYDAQATLLIYEDDVYFCCGPGGNAIWSGVVRAIYDQMIPLSEGEPTLVANAFPLDPDWNVPNLHIVAYTQHPETKEIYQGYRITEIATETAEPEIALDSRILSLAPNPTPGPVSIVLDLTAEDATKSARLEILDAAGRCLARVPAVLQPGRNTIDWNLAAATGRPDGVYFVRLSTDHTTRVGRLIQVR